MFDRFIQWLRVPGSGVVPYLFNVIVGLSVGGAIGGAIGSIGLIFGLPEAVIFGLIAGAIALTGLLLSPPGNSTETPPPPGDNGDPGAQPDPGDTDDPGDDEDPPRGGKQPPSDVFRPGEDGTLTIWDNDNIS